VAVHNLSHNKGSYTPGIDGEVFVNSDTFKLNKVEYLKVSIRDYKAMPVRRINILKTNGRLRPIGIPTIKDRSLQSLKK